MSSGGSTYIHEDEIYSRMVFIHRPEEENEGEPIQLSQGDRNGADHEQTKRIVSHQSIHSHSNSCLLACLPVFSASILVVASVFVAMASSSLLLSSSLTLPLPSSASSSPRPTSATPGAARFFASSRGGVVVTSPGCFEQFAWRQLGFGTTRRRSRVACEVAVELGGPREETTKKVEAGNRIRVLGPLKVFHVPKHPELDIGGFEGEVKEVVTTFKGKPVSATFPYKVQLMTPGDDSRKFFAHLKDDEFEVLE